MGHLKVVLSVKLKLWELSGERMMGVAQSTTLQHAWNQIDCIKVLIRMRNVRFYSDDSEIVLR